MNVLSETYIFYADVYFIQNFIIKVAVIYLSLYCNKIHIHIMTRNGIGKIVCVSAFGTLVEIAGLFLGNSYSFFLILTNILEIPLMFLWIVGREPRQVFRLIVIGYFFLILINGVVESLWNWFGETTSFILLLIFSCSVVVAGIRMWKNYTKMQKGIYRVELIYNETHVSIRGFYDSGNCLSDPYTGKGVHIISADVAKLLGMTERNGAETSPVYIPYHALGNDEGVIEVYYVDELIIEGETQRITKKKCPLGVAKENLFEGKAYEMILNEEVF